MSHFDGPEVPSECDICFTRIIKSGVMEKLSRLSDGAEIISFEADRSSVQAGVPFFLQWRVVADSIDLYRDGVFLQSLNSGEGTLRRSEFHESKAAVTYELLAVKNGLQARSRKIIITHIPSRVAPKAASLGKPRSRRLIQWVVLGAGLVAILGGLAYILTQKAPLNYYLEQKIMRQGLDSLILINGNHILPGQQFDVEVNNIRVDIHSITDGLITVRLADISEIIEPGGAMRIAISEDGGKLVQAGILLFLPGIINVEREMVEEQFFHLPGKFPQPESLTAYLNGQKLSLSVSDSDLSFRVPAFSALQPKAQLEFELFEVDRIVFFSSMMVVEDTINLITNAPEALWSSGIAVGPAWVQTDARPLNYPGKESDVDGFVIATDAYTEDHQLNQVLWTHPRWVANGSITGQYNLRQVGNKRLRADEGFVNNALSSDGATWVVELRYENKAGDVRETLFTEHKVYDARPKQLRINLPVDVGTEFSIKLQVAAGPYPNSDWATWIGPMIIGRRLAFIGAG